MYICIKELYITLVYLCIQENKITSEFFLFYFAKHSSITFKKKKMIHSIRQADPDFNFEEEVN